MEEQQQQDDDDDDEDGDDEDDDVLDREEERRQLQQPVDATSSCEVSSMSMTVWSAIGQRLNALVCHCCERKLPEPENV